MVFLQIKYLKNPIWKLHQAIDKENFELILLWCFKNFLVSFLQLGRLLNYLMESSKVKTPK